MNNLTLNKDINAFLDLYSTFKYDKRRENKFSILRGIMDICDTSGLYLGYSFEIKIYIDKEKYPYCVPIVVELSKLIERDESWHINNDGVCCLDIDHKLEFLSKTGINIIAFYQEVIYPYFANTVYKMNTGKYANGEYLHNFNGVIQFYNEDLMESNSDIIISILKSILENKIPGRNSICICGSNRKFKKCHIGMINFLKSLSRERLIRDLEGFKSVT